MNEFWSKIREKVTIFLVWVVDNHFGKFTGTVLGLILGLLVVILGFWRTLVLMLFVVAGFFLGKLQDEQRDITAWFKNRFH